MQNNGNQNNQQSSNSNLDNAQLSPVNQDNVSRIMQNPSVNLIVDRDLINRDGEAVVDRNMANQRRDQIMVAPPERAYVAKLLASGAITILGTSVSLAINLIACEESRNKVECREISSGLGVGAGLFVWSLAACAILAKNANQPNVRVNPRLGDLPPPYFPALTQESYLEQSTPSNVPENTGSDEVKLQTMEEVRSSSQDRSPSSPRASTLIVSERGRSDQGISRV
jgi:hypothetical protein